MVAGGSLEAAKLGEASQGASKELGSEPDEATSGGPRSKMAKVVGRAETAEEIQSLEALSGRAKVKRNCVLGSTCASWSAFCKMTGRRHAASSGEAALDWSAFHPAGRTFQQYFSHLDKACCPLGFNLDSKTKGVKRAAKGSARLGGRINALQPTVSRTLLVKMVSANAPPHAAARAVWAS